MSKREVESSKRQLVNPSKDVKNGGDRRNDMIRIRCKKETRKLFYAFKVDWGFPTYEEALLWLLANVPKSEEARKSSLRKKS